MDRLDMLSLYDTLSDEEKLIMETAADFTNNEVRPVIGECHRKAIFPEEVIPRMGELGFFGSTLPEEYGCPGIGNRAYGLIMQELERGDSGIRSFASVQGGLVMYPIWKYGSEEQKKYWLPLLASGQKIGCFGLTEHDFGSNPGGMATKAEKDGDSYVLNGTKMWITNGSLADVSIIWAKEGGIVRGFIVEKENPGIDASEIQGKFSLRASDTSEIRLTDCRVPVDAMLPKAAGLKAPLSCLSQARYGIAWGAIGSAHESYHTALTYSQTRVQFKQTIAHYQIIQERLVEMASNLTHAQLLVFRLAELKDSGKAHPSLISLAKRNNVHMALDTSRKARSILGASGIVDDYPVMRHMMNLESVFTYEGTHDIHTLIVGQYLTNCSAIE